MKRKRFIKLVMGKGLSRKNANHMAEIVLDRGGTYVHAWQYFLYLKAEVERRLRDAIKNRFLYGDPELRPYMGLASFPPPNPEPYMFKPVYRIDTKPLDQRAILWPMDNPYIDGYAARITVVDELHKEPLPPGCALEPTICRDAAGNMRIAEVSLVKKAGGEE